MGILSVSCSTEADIHFLYTYFFIHKFVNLFFKIRHYAVVLQCGQITAVHMTSITAG